ncbi:MAG: winged helix-turn-helix transcriptional regulator [bacterium]|nr:winged helix-turn-helix transcriptional regulator [bacterium]
MISYLIVFMFGLVVGMFASEKGVSQSGSRMSHSSQQALKQKREDAIVALVKKQGVVSSADIQKAIGISAGTVTRYTDRLECAGKIVQKGKGRAATYVLARFS